MSLKRHFRDMDEEREITDYINSRRLYPYLVHFGEVGISPKVVGAYTREELGSSYVKQETRKIATVEIVFFEKIEGDRLNGWLWQNHHIEELRAMYKELGYSVGYIHKYGVYHNHLKTANIVVNSQGKPIIIDWKHAESYNGPVEENEPHSTFGDSKLLLPTARRRLEQVGIIGSDSINELEEIYWERRLIELQSPLEITITDLERRAIQLLDE